MNAGEYGIAFALNASYDMSANTNLILIFTRPDKSVLTVTKPQVVLGTTPLTTNDGTFLANQYVTYVTAPGDFDLEGKYMVRLDYFTPGVKLITDPYTFTVNP